MMNYLIFGIIFLIRVYAFREHVAIHLESANILMDKLLAMLKKTKDFSHITLPDYTAIFRNKSTASSTEPVLSGVLTATKITIGNFTTLSRVCNATMHEHVDTITLFGHVKLEDFKVSLIYYCWSLPRLEIMRLNK